MMKFELQKFGGLILMKYTSYGFSKDTALTYFCQKIDLRHFGMSSLTQNEIGVMQKNE